MVEVYERRIKSHMESHRRIAEDERRADSRGDA
jgi:hypothetical protein